MEIVSSHKTIYSIQYLRGLAAVAVLFQHVAVKGEQYAGNPIPWFHLGQAGVELFFIISGFIMCHTTIFRSGSLRSLGHFIKHRFIRILPLYWVLTLAALIIFLIIPEKVNRGGGETQILESFFLIPTDGAYLIKNGWTLSYEFFFYFIFSIGLLFKGWVGHLVTTVILVLFVLGGAVFSGTGAWYSFLTNTILLDFVLGILLYHLFKRAPKINLAFSIFITSLGVVLLVLSNSGITLPVGRLHLGISCFLVSVGFVSMENSFANRPSQFFSLLGDASYSLYLFHPFILSAFSIGLSTLGLVTGWWTIPFLLIIGMGALLGGIVCYWVIEKPVTKLARRCFSRD